MKLQEYMDMCKGNMEMRKEILPIMVVGEGIPYKVMTKGASNYDEMEDRNGMFGKLCVGIILLPEHLYKKDDKQHHRNMTILHESAHYFNQHRNEEARKFADTSSETLNDTICESVVWHIVMLSEDKSEWDIAYIEKYLTKFLDRSLKESREYYMATVKPRVLHIIGEMFDAGIQSKCAEMDFFNCK